MVSFEDSVNLPDMHSVRHEHCLMRISSEPAAKQVGDYCGRLLWTESSSCNGQQRMGAGRRAKSLRERNTASTLVLCGSTESMWLAAFAVRWRQEVNSDAELGTAVTRILLGNKCLVLVSESIGSFLCDYWWNSEPLLITRDIASSL